MAAQKKHFVLVLGLLLSTQCSFGESRAITPTTSTLPRVAGSTEAAPSKSLKVLRPRVLQTSAEVSQEKANPANKLKKKETKTEPKSKSEPAKAPDSNQGSETAPEQKYELLEVEVAKQEHKSEDKPASHEESRALLKRQEPSLGFSSIQLPSTQGLADQGSNQQSSATSIGDAPVDALPGKINPLGHEQAKIPLPERARDKIGVIDNTSPAAKSGAIAPDKSALNKKVITAPSVPKVINKGSANSASVPKGVDQNYLAPEVEKARVDEAAKQLSDQAEKEGRMLTDLLLFVGLFVTFLLVLWVRLEYDYGKPKTR